MWSPESISQPMNERVPNQLVDVKPDRYSVVEMRYRQYMAHSTKRLFGVWIPYVAAAVMVFLIVGNLLTGNVDSIWSWIEVTFLAILAIYFTVYATRAKRRIER